MLADRATVGLAVAAVAAAGVVIGGEARRLVRRRRESDQVPTPATLLDTAGLATRDTVAVAVEGYEGAPRRETILFNMLTGFVGAFAMVRITTWASAAAGGPPARSGSGGGTSITSCRGS